jgi:hypothetical protein
MTQGKTTPELDPLVAPLVDSDVLVVYRSPGQLKRTTAGTILAYVQATFAASGGSALLGFLQAGTGATTVTAQAKLRQAPVQPNAGEFGAFTDATVTTATLLAAFTAAMADGRPVELSGSYTINGPITPVIPVDGAELRIIPKDDVTITVDAGATAFNRVFYAESTTAKSHSVSGPGSLTINCNNKAAAGFWLRHTAASTGGEVLFNAPVTVRNVTAATGITNAAGIIVLGRYERIIMRSPTVEDVTRVDVSGECSGITCSGFDGEVEMYSPVVRRVYYGPGTGDADCIKCFGRQSGTTNNRREGSVRIYSPIIEDGQARLYKDQCGDTIIYRPFGRRYAVNAVSATSSVDFDFQKGGGLVLDAHMEYYKNGSTSPISASHSVFAFQQVVDDTEMYGCARNTTIVSDVAIPRIALVVEGGDASITEIDGLKMLPAGGLATTMITECIMEVNAAEVLAKSTTTRTVVTNVDAPNTNPVIGYRGYVGSTATDFTSKWSVKVDACATSLAITSDTTRAISDLSGNRIKAWQSFEIGDNPGYRNWYRAMAICIKRIKAGAKMSVFLDDCTFVDTDYTTTVTVPWGTSGTLALKGDGVSNTNTTANDAVVVAYFDGASPNSWFTLDGGLNWRTGN